MLAVIVLALAAGLAWANSFGGPFMLDDLPAIAENPTIQHLSSLREVLSPPGNGQTVTGRPLLNLTLALNYAFDGLNVRGYHAANLAIHLLAGLTLFGILRRTLVRPVVPAQWRENAHTIAFASALLWLVHPLTTESVTYLIQRAESLAGLLYLVTLYAFIRGLDSAASWRWWAGSILACLAGMATKEVVVTAPVIVLLYDRTFGAGEFRAALRARAGYYAGLAATWLLMVWLARGSGNRGHTAGFGLGISSWSYALKQCEGILHYLRLAFWPQPLVLDYGFDVVTSWRDVVPQGLGLLALLAVTVVALVRWPVAGFLGAWFFALLAPSSSFIPVATQTVAEHRMYLPLAAVVTGAVCAGWWLMGRRESWIFFAAAAASVIVTANRNRDYRSPLTIWADTIAKRPGNARAHQEYAVAMYRGGNAAASIPEYERALALQPDYARARHNYASALALVGRYDEAVKQYQLAIRQMPELPEPYFVLADLLCKFGKWADAQPYYEAALKLRPDLTGLHGPLANCLAATGRMAEAIPHYEIAVKFAPENADLRNNFGVALLRSDRPAEAAAQFSEALRLKPDFRTAAENLGLAKAATAGKK